MNFYLIGSKDGFNELRFADTTEWQSVMGLNGNLPEGHLSTLEHGFELIYGEKSRRKMTEASVACAPLYLFHRRVLPFLEELLTTNGELIPVPEWEDKFIFFHCTNIIDALVEEESKVTSTSIDIFTLSRQKINKETIFRLPSCGLRYTFFGEEFKQLIEKNKVRGIHFNRWEKVYFK